MVKKEMIVHPDCIEKDLVERDLNPQERASAQEALRVIKLLIQGAERVIIVDDIPVEELCFERRPEADVYILKQGYTGLTRSIFGPGDDVTVYGAYADLCVELVAGAAMKAGATVNVSLRGAIK